MCVVLQKKKSTKTPTRILNFSFLSLGQEEQKTKRSGTHYNISWISIECFQNEQKWHDKQDAVGKSLPSPVQETCFWGCRKRNVWMIKMADCVIAVVLHFQLLHAFITVTFRSTSPSDRLRIRDRIITVSLSAYCYGSDDTRNHKQKGLVCTLRGFDNDVILSQVELLLVFSTGPCVFYFTEILNKEIKKYLGGKGV